MLCLGKKIDEKLAIVAVISGFVATLLWRQFGLAGWMYEGVAGIGVGLMVLSLAGIKKR